MKPTKFSSNLDKINKIAFPSYVTDLQLGLNSLNSHFESTRDMLAQIHKQTELMNSALHPVQNITTEFQKNYRPLELAFPKNFHSEITQSLQGIGQIAEILKTSIPKLSAFQYDIPEFSEEKFEEKEVIELIDNTKIILNKIYKQNDLIDIVDPRDFEKIVAELLHDRGYQVELTKRTRDGGFDVIGLTKVGGIPFKILAECKRHKKTVGIDIIRSFCDVINTENANKGLIFTTSYFSKPAIERKEMMGIILDLKNREELIEWIIQYHEK